MRVERRGRSASAVIAGAVLLLAAACGGAPGEDDEPAVNRDNQDTSPIGDALGPKAKPPGPEIAGAREGGTLTLYSTDTAHTIDPTRINFLDMFEMSRLTMRTLTQYRYDKKTGHMALIPDMATDLGRPNEDFTEWTFTLRDGLKYENGREVKAEDIAYAVKRQFAQEELPGGPTYSLDVLEDGDKYLGPYKPAKKDAKGRYGGDDFPGVEVKDDKTIVFHTRVPYPDLRYTVALAAYTAIPEDADTKQSYENDLLATGPYKIKSYTPEKRLVLTRNEQWDPDTDAGRYQFLDSYDFRFGSEEIALHEQLAQNKGIDQTAMTYDDIPAEIYGKIRGKEPEKRLVTGRDPCVSYAWLDTRKIPLKVRGALAAAWPIADEAKVLGDIPGLTHLPGTTLMPSTTPGWLKHDAIGRGGKGSGNPEKAKSMLNRAGKEGFEVSYYYASNEASEQRRSVARQEALEKAGFTVKPIAVSDEKLRELGDDPTTPVNVRDGSWCPDWPSGSSVFPAVFDGRKAEQPGAPVPSFLDKSEVNDEIDRISKLPPAKGMKAWGQLDKLIMDKYLPAIPTDEGGSAYLHGSKVANVHHDEVRGQPDLTQIYLRE